MFCNKAGETGNHWLMLWGAVPGYIATIVWLVVFLSLSPAVGASDGDTFAPHRNGGKAEDLSGELLKFPTIDGDLVVFSVDLECTWNVQEAVTKHYNFG